MQNAYPSEILFILSMHGGEATELSSAFNRLGFPVPESTRLADLNDRILESAKLPRLDWSLGDNSFIRSSQRE